MWQFVAVSPLMFPLLNFPHIQSSLTYHHNGLQENPDKGPESLSQSCLQSNAFSAAIKPRNNCSNWSHNTTQMKYN